MKQVFYSSTIILFTFISEIAFACPTWPDCYSVNSYSAPPGDINANGILGHFDLSAFTFAESNDPTTVLNCSQIAGMDIDLNGLINKDDTDIMENAITTNTPLPNSHSSWGDVNEDGMLNQKDALDYFNYTNQSIAISPWGDVDGNGEINDEDASILTDCLRDRIHKLPVIQ